MPDIYHTVLPPDWTHLKGLQYPLVLTFRGETVIMRTYDEHHYFIKKVFAEEIRNSKINTVKIINDNY